MQYVKVMIDPVKKIKPTPIKGRFYILDMQINRFILAVIDKNSSQPTTPLFYTPKGNLLASGEQDVDMFDSCIRVFNSEEAAISAGNQLKMQKNAQVDTLLLFQIVRNRTSDGYIVCRHHKTI